MLSGTYGYKAPLNNVCISAVLSIDPFPCVLTIESQKTQKENWYCIFTNLLCCLTNTILPPSLFKRSKVHSLYFYIGKWRDTVNLNRHTKL